MGRMLLASNENDDNYTSVGDCGHLLQEIYKQDISGYTHATDMFNLLKAQTRCNKIPAQLPEGVKTANKTGELDNVENDAGIIYDSKNDVVIVFMSQNLSSAGSAQNTIATLSRTIYDYYN
jgi:beta-lactamase class A